MQGKFKVPWTLIFFRLDVKKSQLIKDYLNVVPFSVK